MPLDTSNARYKLGQARSQLKRAHAIFSAWATPENVAMVFVREEELSCDHFGVQVRTLPGPEFSLEVGDFLSNARDALDYLAWLIYRAAGGDPDDGKANQVYFPIASEETKWRDAKKSIPNRWPEAEQVLWGQQDAQREAPDNTLYMLHKLANSKKHRDLHLVSLSGDRTITMIEPDLPDGYGAAISFVSGTPVLEPESVTYLSSYFIYRLDDPNAHPVRRTEQLTMERPDPPEWDFGLTDEKVTVRLEHLSVMADRVDQAITAVSTLTPPERLS